MNNKMTDIIHNYPKSSCTYYNCENDKFKMQTGVNTNMSVRGCNFSEYFDYYPESVFKVQQEPVQKHGKMYLNHLAIQEKIEPNYKSINPSTKGTTYLNADPRLYNAAAATWLQLDRPPVVSAVELNTLTTDKSLNCYGQGYKSYADVNAGQILYYINKSQEDVFYEPVFSKQATTVGTIYQDPMGNIKPQYNRIPNEKYNPITGDPYNVAGDFCLSFMKDTQYARENIMASHQRKHNEQRYAPRWTNNLD